MEIDAVKNVESAIAGDDATEREHGLVGGGRGDVRDDSLTRRGRHR